MNSSHDVNGLLTSLPRQMHRLNSLDDLEAWLSSQPGVLAVERASGVIKTAPPLIEFRVTFYQSRQASHTITLDFVIYPDETFKFSGYHDDRSCE